MHTVQKSALNLGHVYAHHAKICPESEAHFCTPCNVMPRIWGWFFHFWNGFSDVQRQIMKSQKWYIPDFRQATTIKK
jgi:hypothetical protein